MNSIKLFIILAVLQCTTCFGADWLMAYYKEHENNAQKTVLVRLNDKGILNVRYDDSEPHLYTLTEKERSTLLGGLTLLCKQENIPIFQPPDLQLFQKIGMIIVEYQGISYAKQWDTEDIPKVFEDFFYDFFDKFDDAK